MPRIRRIIWKLIRFGLRAGLLVIVVAGFATALLALESKDPSVCYGSVSKGRLENAKRLPATGENFQAYWLPGWLFGRTNMHGAVRDVVAETYQRLANARPDLTFVYGETGWPWGGRFWPHRSHRNGLSVDFVVPVRNFDRQSVPFPRSMWTGGFYAVEMDGNAQFDDGVIDFEAMALHLDTLRQVGADRGVPVARIFFDPALQPRLFATQRGRDLASNMRFSSNRSWFRHDAHYHVDFDVTCRPM